MEKNISVIAITGGPCGGKSTFLAKAHSWLQKYGIQLIIVSETATEVKNSGIIPELVGFENFEKLLLGYQIKREDMYLSVAESIGKGKSVAILCDRGALDCAAYVSKETFARISGEAGYPVKNLMARYNLVVHMMTAAIGAEKFYTLKNNSVRKETIKEARELDEKTQKAWLGHPHHIIIDNRTGFRNKMLRTLQSLARVLNMPRPNEIERKFRVLNFDYGFIPSDAVILHITQDYLKQKRGGPERRLRMSEMEGQKSFYYTEKMESGEVGSRYEKESVITRNKYLKLYAERNPKLNTVKKDRYCFIRSGKKFELDIYRKPESVIGMAILEIELSKINEKIDFPPGWELQEVTGDKKFSNRKIAERS